jgi:hypothetical protein
MVPARVAVIVGWARELCVPWPLYVAVSVEREEESRKAQARTYLIHWVSSVIVWPGVTIFEVDLVRRARLAGLSSSSFNMDSSEDSFSEVAVESGSGLPSSSVGGKIVIAMAVREF